MANKEELIERYKQMCDYWFGDFGYSKDFKNNAESGRTYLEAVGMFAADKNEEIEENGYPHSIAFYDSNECKGCMDLYVRILDHNAYDLKEVWQCLDNIVYNHFVVKKQESYEKRKCYHVSAVR